MSMFNVSIFNVGDRVVIREGMHQEVEEGTPTLDGLDLYQVFTINEIDVFGFYGSEELLDEDGHSSWFYPNEIELYMENGQLPLPFKFKGGFDV